jgi:hypothetical protein
MARVEVKTNIPQKTNKRIINKVVTKNLVVAAGRKKNDETKREIK